MPPALQPENSALQPENLYTHKVSFSLIARVNSQARYEHFKISSHCDWMEVLAASMAVDSCESPVTMAVSVEKAEKV
jgi:hypothetical protein